MRDFFETISEKVTLGIILIASIIVDYFAYFSIQRLPKPSTTQEYITYLFNKPDDFYKTFAFVCFASILTILLSLSIGSYSFFSEGYHPVVRIILGILAIIIFGIGLFYYGYYLISLLFALLVIGFIGYIFLSSDSGKSRRRY